MLWNDTNTGMVLRAHEAREAQEAAAKLGVRLDMAIEMDITAMLDR
jgi:hypothetical protein